MKKAIKILLMTAFVLSLLCVTAMAADNTSDGFFGIGTEENVELTPYVGTSTTAVTSTEKDVDSDGSADTWYENSDRIEVSYSGAVVGKEYGVILVKGTDLPTVNDNICFIDQVTATSTTVEFNVYPILPEETTPMTLYISSNETGFELKDILVSYAVGVAGEEPPATTVLYGDVNEDGNVRLNDAVLLRRHVAGQTVSINLANADCNANGSVQLNDAVLLARKVAGQNVVLGPQS